MPTNATSTSRVRSYADASSPSAPARASSSSSGGSLLAGLGALAGTVGEMVAGSASGPIHWSSGPIRLDLHDESPAYGASALETSSSWTQSGRPSPRTSGWGGPGPQGPMPQPTPPPASSLFSTGGSSSGLWDQRPTSNVRQQTQAISTTTGRSEGPKTASRTYVPNDALYPQVSRSLPRRRRQPVVQQTTQATSTAVGRSDGPQTLQSIYEEDATSAAVPRPATPPPQRAEAPVVRAVTQATSTCVGRSDGPRTTQQVHVDTASIAAAPSRRPTTALRSETSAVRQTTQATSTAVGRSGGPQTSQRWYDSLSSGPSVAAARPASPPPPYRPAHGRTEAHARGTSMAGPYRDADLSRPASPLWTERTRGTALRDLGAAHGRASSLDAGVLAGASMVGADPAIGRAASVPATAAPAGLGAGLMALARAVGAAMVAVGRAIWWVLTLPYSLAMAALRNA